MSRSLFDYVVDITQLAVGLCTFILLIIALVQYLQSIKTTKLKNSLDVLSWFDEEKISELIEDIYKDSQHKEELRLDETRVKLLFYLDTAYKLMDKKIVYLKYFYQMHEDFVRISKHAGMQATLDAMRDQLPDLDLKKIAKITKPHSK